MRDVSTRTVQPFACNCLVLGWLRGTVHLFNRTNGGDSDDDVMEPSHVRGSRLVDDPRARAGGFRLAASGGDLNISVKMITDFTGAVFIFEIIKVVIIFFIFSHRHCFCMK